MSELVNQRFMYVPVSAIFLSVGLHVLLGALLLAFHVTGYFGFQKLQSKKSLYQDFIQVDVVALPDELPNQKSTVDELVTAAPKVIATIRPPSQPELMVIPREKWLKEKSADLGATEAAKTRQDEQEKALKAIEEEARREKVLKALAFSKGKNEGRAQLKGNILAQGNSRTGDIGSPKDIYDSRVREAIKQHFNVYSWQKNRDLVTIVHIDLFPSGRVRKKKLVTTSSDRLYDAAVLQAIDQAQPLPVPDDLSLISNGITVEFKPTE